MSETATERPWEDLAEAIARTDRDGVIAMLESLSVEDQRRSISRLHASHREDLIHLLKAKEAADLLEHLAETQAVELLEGISTQEAASIIEELPDHLRGEMLRKLDEDDAAAILDEFEDTARSEQLRERIAYPWDSAGGMMSEAVISFPIQATAGTVLMELSENAERYADRDVQYVYVTDEADRLAGVVRLRDLVLTRKSAPLSSFMIADPVSVDVETTLQELKSIFDDKAYLGLPVVGADGVLKGVVSREVVREAQAEHQTEDYLRSSGIVSGEELRSMPLATRSFRRMVWLVPNIILNMIAASVIAAYEDTLQAVIVLAVFLPIVSDMSGCSGNQAVAVSIRELTLGILRPSDYLRVLFKEGLVGLCNGAILGILLGSIAAIWQGNIWLGTVIGAALMLNTILSVLIGGLVPLLLKRLHVDPALASGPILTTCTDMCGFFLVLNLASLTLSRLG